MSEQRENQREPWNDLKAEPYVRIEAITKRFGSVAAVNNVSLKIYRGEIFCLLGGSGCGKTTLLRMLGGFEQPTAGEIYIDGEAMAGIPPYERPVNMMFQSYALFPHMTVAKNIAFGLEQEGLGRAEISRRVQEILDIVKMTQFAGRKPHQLSGGQRQRVAIARALVGRPAIVLADEPTGNLDQTTGQAILRLFEELHELGATIVVITHDHDIASRMDRRIEMLDGNIVFDGANKSSPITTTDSRATPCGNEHRP